MPAFSNANDITAIMAIRVKILFFLMKSIILYRIYLLNSDIKELIIKSIITITNLKIYLGDLVNSIKSKKWLLKNMIKV